MKSHRIGERCRPRPSRRLLALFAATLLAGCSCSGCDGKDGEPADSGPSPDHPAYERPDARPRDIAVDYAPDPRCGGSRTLTPRPIERGKGKACGRGCRQVTFGASVGVSYEVRGNLLVYAGRPGIEYQEQVYLVNLEQGKEWLIRSNGKTTRGCQNVATDGQRLGYSCGLSSGKPTNKRFTDSLTTYDPRTNAETDVQCWTSDGNDGSTSPTFVGLGSTGIVTSVAPDGPARNVWYYSFADKTLSNLSKSGGDHVQMQGHRIVWRAADPARRRRHIKLYDTKTKTERFVDPSGGNQWAPRIEGDEVVFTDHRATPGSMYDRTNSDIYVHHIKTGKTVAATTHPAGQDRSDVHGDWVVWEDYRHNIDPTAGFGESFTNIDIYAKNLKTGKVLHVTSFSGLETRPQVDDGRVFFEMRSANGLAVFMIDLAKRFP